MEGLWTEIQKNIEDDYVSFDLAKRLKSIGFNYLTNKHWNPGIYNDLLFNDERYCNWNGEEHLISCPTISLSAKWLRKERHLFVTASYTLEGNWEFCIFNMKFQKVMATGIKRTYESSMSAAINYAIDFIIDESYESEPISINEEVI